MRTCLWRWTGNAENFRNSGQDRALSMLRYDQISPVLTEFLAREGFTKNCEISLAGIAGSRRAYYRLSSRLGSVIVLVSSGDDADFGRFLRITQFYRMAQIPVPRVFCIDDAAHQVLLEDLGSQRLYDLFKRDPSAGLESYRNTLDLLVDLQTRCQALHRECPDIQSRIFDREQLLWETSYYRAQYLEGYRGLSPDTAFDAHLKGVFDELAGLVDDHPKAIMHRDFQSQNLMVQADGSVHVIDYQGSRQGSIYYDLASLLLDPYVMLSGAEIDELLRYFHKGSPSLLDFTPFREAFLQAGLQRVMQALGAYCFLSRVKGIASFAEHIPAGEKRLWWLLREFGRKDWESILP
jgi:aminoglycoside/choline kinase family phosphotransferase